MDSLARKVAERLTVHTGRAVQEVTENPDGGVRLVFADGRVVTAREVVLAVPAPVARKLYPSAPAEELPFLDATSYSRMIRVTLQVNRPLAVRQSRGTKKVYALLIPEKEDGYLAGLTFEHFKAANRAPRGQGLVSMLSAERATDELMDRPDEEVVEKLLGRATRYVPELREALIASQVHRFPYAAPEATPDALRLQGAFLDRPVRAVEFAGDWVFQRPTSEAAVQAGSWPPSGSCRGGGARPARRGRCPRPAPDGHRLTSRAGRCGPDGRARRRVTVYIFQEAVHSPNSWRAGGFSVVGAGFRLCGGCYWSDVSDHLLTKP